MPMGNCGDHIFRYEGGIASEENAVDGRLEGGFIDHRQIPFPKLDAEVALDPGEGIVLPYGNDDVIGSIKTSVPR